MQTKDKTILQKILPIAAIVMIICGAIVAGYGLFDGGMQTASYSDNGSNIKYRVYLKKNQSFQESYINGASNRTYATSLIDHLSIDFDYGLNFDREVKGDIIYQLVATISIDKTDGAAKYNFNTIERQLSEPTVLHVSGSSLNIVETTAIDYDDYVAILDEFESISNYASAAGTLTVALKIDGDILPSGFSTVQTISAQPTFSIPLTKNASVEAKTNALSAGGNTQYLKEISDRRDSKHIAFMSAGIAIIIVGLIIIGRSAWVRHLDRLEHPYEEDVRKILANYDSIIVDIKKAPSLTRLNVSEVDSFEELLDVYNSVHLPINYYSTKDVSHFLVISDKAAWHFSLKASDYKRK